MPAEAFGLRGVEALGPDGVSRPASALEVRTLMAGERPVVGELVGQIGPEIDRLIDDMFALMRRAGYVALSGPVVGAPFRVVTIDLTGSGRSQIALLDPVLEAVSIEKQRDLEGCLQLPDMRAKVDRHLWVTVRATTRHGQRVRLQAGGILARILQHHIDHLDGETPLDRVGRRQRQLVEARWQNHPRSPLPAAADPPARSSASRATTDAPSTSGRP
jgi:peptide deformylase